MKLEHNTLQVELPKADADRILMYADATIDRQFVIQRERTPHVTIKYGILEDDPQRVADAICPFIPIRMMLGMNNLFPAIVQRPADVIYMEVYGESLKRLREKVEANVETIENDFPYIPHMTLAYLKEMCGMQYMGPNGFNNHKVVVDSVVFQLKDKTKYTIHRDGRIEDYK